MSCLLATLLLPVYGLYAVPIKEWQGAGPLPSTTPDTPQELQALQQMGRDSVVPVEWRRRSNKAGGSAKDNEIFRMLLMASTRMS